jgi:outer membrane lipoprotein SlyB
MDTSIRTHAPLHPLYKAAAVSVIAVSITGVAAMSGMMPFHKGLQAQTQGASPAAFSTVDASRSPPINALGAVPGADRPASATAPMAATMAAPSAVPMPVPALESRPAPPPKRIVTQRNSAIDSPRPAQRDAPRTATYDPAPPPVTFAQNSPPAPSAPVVKPLCTSCGVIEGISEIEKTGDGSGLGMAGGAVGGAVLGRQFGNGRGRDALTILGAVTGGYAGHQVEKNMRTTKSYEVRVRMEDGSLRSLPSATLPQWRAGDRVRVEGGSISPNFS